MINFVYGAPGTGKTHFIFERLKKNSVGAFLIVPEQQTVSAERLSLDLLGASAQLDFEVLNFTRLCNRVFRKYGGLSYNYINSSVRSLMMWRTIRELTPLLSEYRAVGNELSLTDVMLRASDELSAASVTSSMLESAAKKLPDGRLKNKLSDISLINAAYTNLVSESFDDKSVDLVKLESVLKKNGFFSGSSVYIDSFTSFTSPELAIIKQIFRQADDVYITLGCESPDCGLICCESVCETAKKLKELASSVGKEFTETKLYHSHRAKNSELQALTTDFWRSGAFAKMSDKIKEDERGNLNILRCSNTYDQASAVVSIISQELRRGLKYREIAVIARDVSQYDGILDTALENANISFFMSKNNDISSTPTISLLLSALRIKYLGFKPEDVLAHLKTGLYDLPPRDIDMFEEYVHTWNLSGARFLDDGWSLNPDGYTEHVSSRGKRILSAANSVRSELMRNLSPFFARLDVAENAADMCRAVYNYIVDIDIAEKLRRVAAGEMEKGNRRGAVETLSIWNFIVDMLDDIKIALSDEQLSVEDLYRAILLCVKNASVGAIPTGYDEVTVGSASLIRTSDIRCAIIIGLNEGEFPAKINDAGIFTDADRSAMSDIGIKLSSDTASRAAEELLFARRALTLPSERLFMLYSATDSSGSGLLRPSMLINRALNFFDYLESKDFAEGDPAEAIWTISSAKERLTELSGTDLGAAISAELDSRGVFCSPLYAVNTDCSVSEKTAKSVFGSNLLLSQSSIDDFVNCRFNYYCKRVLSLRDEEKAIIDARISGSFIHAVLERFMKQAVTENGITDTDTEILVDGVIEELIDGLCTEVQKSSNRLRHLFLRMRRISLLLIRSLSEELESSDFKPEFFEYDLSKDKNDPLTFKLRDGTTVTLRGKIDRVDLFKDGDKVYVRVVDYKTGEKKFSLDDIASGLNLQLVVYLFALCRANTSFAEKVGCAPNVSPIPAAANYLSSYITPQKYQKIPKEDEIFDSAIKSFDRSGFFLDDEAVLSALNKNETPKRNLLNSDEIEKLRAELETVITNIAEEMRSGKIGISPRLDGRSPCNFCSMAQVCRNAQKDRF